MHVAGIQETHWFGQMYEVDGAVASMSGRRTPGKGQSSR